MAEPGKPQSSEVQNMDVEAGSDETLLQDALIIQNQLDNSKKSKGINKPPPFPHPEPADDEDEITARCHAYQEQQKQKQKSGK